VPARLQHAQDVAPADGGPLRNGGTHPLVGGPPGPGGQGSEAPGVLDGHDPSAGDPPGEHHPAGPCAHDGVAQGGGQVDPAVPRGPGLPGGGEGPLHEEG